MVSAKLTLDKRVRKKDGTFPVKITISHGASSAHISLGISLHPAEWDAVRCRPTGTAKHLQPYTAQRLAEVQTAMLQINGKRAMTARQLRDAILQHLAPNEKPTFGQWYEQFTQSHENARTRAIYSATLHLIKLFDPTAYKANFEEITKSWLDNFFASLAQRSPSVNARNIHLRNIRAVFNSAIDNDITAAYPFRRMQIKPTPTAKRSLPVDELRRIINIRPRSRHVDCFLLSIYLVGINPVDLLTLTHDTIVDGRIIYTRHKTHKLYNIYIQPEAREIMERHRGEKLLLDFAEHCSSYRHFTNRCNEHLRTLHQGTTLYWARHTWATLAADLDIPDDTISLALGHSARNATTDIYIRRNLQKVDDANRRVLDFISGLI